MSNSLEETKFLMNKYNIKAKKSLGQNFLINEDVVFEIIEKSNVSKDDLVIEIGPGLGTLTSYLLEKAGFVIAIELDKKMINILTDRFFSYPRISLTTNFGDEGTHAESSVNDLQVPLAGLKKGVVLDYRISSPDESLSVYDAYFENMCLSDFLPEDIKEHRKRSVPFGELQ